MCSLAASLMLSFIFYHLSSAVVKASRTSNLFLTFILYLFFKSSSSSKRLSCSFGSLFDLFNFFSLTFMIPRQRCDRCHSLAWICMMLWDCNIFLESIYSQFDFFSYPQGFSMSSIFLGGFSTMYSLQQSYTLCTT